MTAAVWFLFAATCLAVAAAALLLAHLLRAMRYGEAARRKAALYLRQLDRCQAHNRSLAWRCESQSAALTRAAEKLALAKECPDDRR